MNVVEAQHAGVLVRDLTFLFWLGIIAWSQFAKAYPLHDIIYISIFCLQFQCYISIFCSFFPSYF